MLKQKELFTNSWGVNSGFKTLVDELNNLLPVSGRCEKPLSTNKNLEYFRRAQNAVYDFFNNGLCNKRGLFVEIFAQNENYYIDKWNIPTQSSFRYFTKDLFLISISHPIIIILFFISFLKILFYPFLVFKDIFIYMLRALISKL